MQANPNKVSVTPGVVGPDGRKNDCAVRAYATLHGLSYEVSEAEFARAGRRQDKGTPGAIVMKVFLEKAEWELEAFGTTKPAQWWVKCGAKHTQKGMTLKTLLNNPKYKQGKYGVLISGHIFAMIDGVVYDKWTMPVNKRVTGIFTYKGATNDAI